MQLATPLLPSHEMLTSTWDENIYIHFFFICSTPFVDESTLCSPKMTLVNIVIIEPTRVDLFFDFVQLKDLVPLMQLKPKEICNRN
jgi:hypothetical protein